MERQRQYKWRRRRRNKRILMSWLTVIAALSVTAAFIYRGMYDSDPAKIAERYVREELRAEDYTLTKGDQKSEEDGSLIQTFMVSYKPADGGKEAEYRLDVVSQDKRYGIFERWTCGTHQDEVRDFKITVPVDSEVWMDKKQLTGDLIKEDGQLSPGAASYVIPFLEKREYSLKVAGLPFETYESKLNPEQGQADVREALKLSASAKTQMQELGKQAVKEIFTAAVNQENAEKLPDMLSKVENRETILEAVTANMGADPDLAIEKLEFNGFAAEFSEASYPEPGEEKGVTVEMKLKYQCKYTGERTDGEEAKQEESRTVAKEAKFHFVCQDSRFGMDAMDIPGLF